METLTKEHLRSIFDYDAESGLFTRKASLGNSKKGKVEQDKNGGGYIRICVKGKYRLAHRLAWLYVFGELPKVDIDHINRDRCDNRIANLRLVSKSENSQNSGISKRNTSGVKGVTWNKNVRKWQVYIQADLKPRYIGIFDQIDAAATAYAIAAAKYHRLNPCASKGQL